MKKVLIGILLGVGTVLGGYSVSKNSDHFQYLYFHGTVVSRGVYTIKLQDNTYCVTHTQTGIHCDFSERIK